MRFLRRCLILGSLAGLSAGITACGLLFDTSPPPPPPPEERIEAADRELRAAITEAMLQAAEELGIRIDSERILFVSRDDLLVVHTPVSGFETLEVGADGHADVGMVYLRLPETFSVKRFTGERKPITPDFYVVRIYPPQTKAVLLNVHGRPGATVRLDRAKTWPSPRPQIDVTGCKILLRYVQEQVFLGPPPIRAEVPLDGCED
jgi:hypothetical protein